MTEEEKSEEKERKSLEEEKKKMREKMKEMQEKGGPRAMPGGSGLASMMQQMAGAGARGGQQNRAMMKVMKDLSSDMEEIKGYLKEILNIMQEK